MAEPPWDSHPAPDNLLAPIWDAVDGRAILVVMPWPPTVSLPTINGMLEMAEPPWCYHSFPKNILAHFLWDARDGGTHTLPLTISSPLFVMLKLAKPPTL